MDFDPRDYVEARDRDDDDRMYGSLWGEDPRDRDDRERDIDARETTTSRTSTTRSTFRTSGIEYELDGRDRHEDVEVVTANYQGAHAASRARAGFTCVRGGGGSRGGSPFDPRAAEDYI